MLEDRHNIPMRQVCAVRLVWAYPSWFLDDNHILFLRALIVRQMWVWPEPLAYFVLAMLLGS